MLFAPRMEPETKIVSWDDKFNLFLSLAAVSDLGLRSIPRDRRRVEPSPCSMGTFCISLLLCSEHKPENFGLTESVLV
jgi:hypothetical protein